MQAPHPDDGTFPSELDSAKQTPNGRGKRKAKGSFEAEIMKDEKAAIRSYLHYKFPVALCYRVQEFEISSLNIVDYTMDTLRKNIKLCIRVDREMAELYFTTDIAELYLTSYITKDNLKNDHMFQFLLQQVSLQEYVRILAWPVTISRCVAQ